MNVEDMAYVFRTAGDAARVNDCAAAAEHLDAVAEVVAEDPVLGMEMWTAMRDALFMIASAERGFS